MQSTLPNTRIKNNLHNTLYEYNYNLHNAISDICNRAYNFNANQSKV